MESLEFGVDWYPEHWDESGWERDADRMRAHGFTVARIMEFAWILVEPEPGRFDFSLFDRALAVLAARGIKAVIGTPTATPPAWLIDESPDALRLSRERVQNDFGTRRNLCWNAPGFRHAARRVSRAVAEHYGGDPRVAGFQVDNEPGHEGSDRCACGHCALAWHAWLQARYGTVDAMNERWGAVFWGTSYARWNQVPVPRLQPSSGHNPGLVLDYDRFCSDSASSFLKEQTAILRERASPGQWITTNLYPPPLSNAIDMEEACSGMDFASWDNYPSWGADDRPLPWAFNAFAQSYIRGLRGNRPFTVMESMAGMQGHVCLGYLPPERQVALWTVQTIARGANRVLFFNWRTAPFGQEQLCHGLLDADDQETERLRALVAMMARAKRELAPIASVPAKNPACLVCAKDDARVLREQYLSKGLHFSPVPFVQAGYDVEAAKWFAPYAVFGVGADIASSRSVCLDDYRLVSLPLHQMADPAFVTRLTDWVERGGTLVLGYRAGARDMDDRSVSRTLPGEFSALAGVRVPRFESLNEGSARIRVGLMPAKGTVWADLIEPTGASVVARWTDRSKFYRSCPAVTVNRVGKGSVWYLGTSLDPAGMFFVYRRILRSAGLRARFAGPDAERVRRADASGREFDILLNHSPRARRVSGVALGPWDWKVVPAKPHR